MIAAPALRQGSLNITIDGQFGSTGKGLLNAWLSQNNIDIAISNAAPNAGHTYIDDTGKPRTAYHLPVGGILNQRTQIYLCAGSIIDPDLLAREMAEFDIDPARVTIHPRACILLPEHAEQEQQAQSGTTALASTRKGVGAALADKIARKSGPRTAAQFFATDKRIGVIDLEAELRQHGKTALMEVPQGFSLSINHGLAYPFCTSRDITVSSALNDAGLHPALLGHVIASLRSFPIRVGNIVDDAGNEIGNSGPFYSDSREISWDDIGVVPERTTVTKRIRRIATFSFIEYDLMLRQLRPDVVFLNFCNYLRSADETTSLLAGMERVEAERGLRPARYYGLGPAAADIIRSTDAADLWQKISGHKKTAAA